RYLIDVHGHHFGYPPGYSIEIMAVPRFTVFVSLCYFFTSLKAFPRSSSKEPETVSFNSLPSVTSYLNVPFTFSPKVSKVSVPLVSWDNILDLEFLSFRKMKEPPQISFLFRYENLMGKVPALGWKSLEKKIFTL
ncbi:hypothetical protein LCGC14_1739360, partial [marine sediment metagenome]